MLPRERRAIILTRVREQGGIRVSDVARELGASPMSVRRDIEALERQGFVVRVHGGAAPSGGTPGGDDSRLQARAHVCRAEKTAIARAAAALITPGSYIALTAGTTTCLLAERILHTQGLTVLTNSMRVARALGRGGPHSPTVLLTGGLGSPSDALVGPIAREALRSLRLDVAFLGTFGMDVQAGFTTRSVLEAETNHAVIRAARKVVILADHTKWTVVGTRSYAPLSAADIVVTDDGVGREGLLTLRRHVRDVKVVSPGDELRTTQRSVS